MVYNIFKRLFCLFSQSCGRSAYTWRWLEKSFFGVGDFKDVYKQFCKNPLTEIVACKQDGHWLRNTGRAVFETDPKYSEKALEAAPHLKSIYNDETSHKLAMFHLEDRTAADIPMMGEGENLL